MSRHRACHVHRAAICHRETLTGVAPRKPRMLSGMRKYALAISRNRKRNSRRPAAKLSLLFYVKWRLA